ncbi:MAG: DUF1801 domain-containing protein [Bacteroidetes bacterium]|nr:DUF1801 domain-containing protein [Bacteroidota bacterium]
MQEVSFRDIDEFLDYLPADERMITESLRQIILGCDSRITEKLSYNVPYYKLHRRFCFIWPASILWGKKKSYEGVRLGFTSGHLLSDASGYLDRGNRKFVSYKDFRSVTEIEADTLRAYLYEALAIDENAARSRSFNKF